MSKFSSTIVSYMQKISSYLLFILLFEYIMKNFTQTHKMKLLITRSLVCGEQVTMTGDDSVRNNYRVLYLMREKERAGII